MKLSDKVFIEEFESLSLEPELFDHRAHMRLAWLYLNTYTLEQAIEKMVTGLSRYAASLGAQDKFQHTLTEATIRIMALRLEQSHTDTFESYLAQNRDIADDLVAVINAYYSSECLNSEKAKRAFVSPDLKSFYP